MSLNCSTSTTYTFVRRTLLNVSINTIEGNARSTFGRDLSDSEMELSTKYELKYLTQDKTTTICGEPRTRSGATVATAECWWLQTPRCLLNNDGTISVTSNRSREWNNPVQTLACT